MPPLEQYIKQAHGLALEVIKTEGVSRQAGKLSSMQFKDLFDKACRYLDAKRVADNRREYLVLSVQEAMEEKESQREFAEAYKSFHEKHEPFHQQLD